MLWPLREKLLGSSRILHAMAERGGTAPAPAVNGADPASSPEGDPAEKQRLDDIHNVWEKPAEDPEKGEEGDKDKGERLSSEQINAALDQHVKNMNLLDGIDTEAIMNGLSNSDPSALVNALQTTSENVAKRLIPTMAQLMDRKIQAAVENAVSEARGATQTDLAYQRMESALPFTKEGFVQPVARAVMKQQLQKGKSEEDAIGVVKGFFNEIFTKGSKDLGIQNPPRNRPGQSRSQQAAIADISEEGEGFPDFEAIWKGQR